MVISKGRPLEKPRKRSLHDKGVNRLDPAAMTSLFSVGVPEVSPRQRLIDAIDYALAKSDLLIVAGMGFGKRALVRGWAARQKGRAVSWASDDDVMPPYDFSGIVIASEHNKVAIEALGMSGRSWRLLLVATQYPGRDLSVAQLNGGLTILDAEQVRMDSSEIAILFQSASSSVIANIMAWTGGWPLAVQALTTRLSGSADLAADMEAAFASLSSAIHDFCENHVLAAASMDEHRQLTALCAMQEANVALANVLTEGEGAAALDTAMRFGLIRRMPDRSAQWQVSHPVLARHLQQAVKQKNPDAIRTLHEKAAEYFGANDYPELAIYHARHAEDWQRLASLVESSGGWRLAVDWRNRQSDRDWLHNCVEDIPESLIEGSSKLRLARAMLRFCSGDTRRAMRDYDVLACLDQEPDPALSLEISMVGHLMRMLEERPPSLQRRREIEKCIEQLPSSDIMSIAVMENALSIAAAQRGETEDAIESADRATRLYLRSNSAISVSVVGLIQARACSDAGLRNLATKSLTDALGVFEKQLGTHSDLARCARVLMGQEAFSGNDIETARLCLADALPWVETQEPQFHAPAYLTSVRLAALESGLDAAASLIDTCIRLAQRGGFDRLERLAQICWLEQLCGADEAQAAARLAGQVMLGSVPDNKEDRLLALAATMIMAEIEIGCGDPAAAAQRLTTFRDSGLWLGTVKGHAQWHTLYALAAAQQEDSETARSSIAEAIRYAVPEGLSRIFIARGRDVYPILRDHQKEQQRKGRFANHAEDEFVSDILNSIRRERRMHRLSVEGVSLTAKEEEILTLLTKGLSNKEIARIVGASDNTVKWHLKNMFRLFNVTSRNELVTSYHININRRTDRNILVSMTSLRVQ